MSFLSGFWLKHVDPRIVAVAGGILFSAGIFFSSFAAYGIWVLYLSVGLIAGIGLGIVVCGFGAGALITAPIATDIIATVGVLRTFVILGIAFFVVTLGCGLLMRDPPPG